MTKKFQHFAKLKTRPSEKERLFQSEVIEKVIREVAAKINDPELQRMFKQCFPNTFDPTTYYWENPKGQPDTFIITGDIPAMWLRDSTNQV